jgi:hypothetical protein|nr:MAG: hypothetical protein [Bacteriophage sp.]
MPYTNSQILSAIIGKFATPIIQQFGGSKFASIPIVQTIENKVRSIGIVSSSWSLSAELTPLIEGVTGKLAVPIINNYISRIPDEQIPYVAHSVVDTALKNGKLELFEGYLEFEKADLMELKRLLNINLPLPRQEEYAVKTELSQEGNDPENAKKEEETIKQEEL